jgi:hypothetical protein
VPIRDRGHPHERHAGPVPQAYSAIAPWTAARATPIWIQRRAHEFSIVSGLTGNFTNPHTGYTNGIDWHTDWAASQFVTKQLQLGAVGYFYQQITPDSGAAPILGAFASRVAGIGPQVGYLFPVGNMQGYVNLKAYWEFAAQNRPEGWNAWVTFSLSPAAPTATSPSPVVTK